MTLKSLLSLETTKALFTLSRQDSGFDIHDSSLRSSSRADEEVEEEEEEHDVESEYSSELSDLEEENYHEVSEFSHDENDLANSTQQDQQVLPCIELGFSHQIELLEEANMTLLRINTTSDFSSYRDSLDEEIEEA